jgi:DNA invertase Pin-like site-specific DNA recombinase
MKKNKIERAAIYYRYSSEKDAQVENSQRRQEDMLKNYCINKKWTIEWRGGDKATSGDKDKPMLMELKRAVEEKQILVDVIVVASWDRITRRHILDFQEDVKWIADAGIKLCLQQEDRIFDLTNNEDAINLSIKVYEANRYLKSLSSNVRSGMEARFRRGELGYGRPPFGYDKDANGKLIPNDDLPLVKQIFDTFLSTSVIACVPVMRKAKRYQESGKAPSSTAVKTVLRNTIYVGLRTFGVAGTGRHGTIRGNETSGSRNVNRLEQSALPVLDVSDEVPAVIDDDVFNKVQSILDENKKRRPRRDTAKYKYSGFVRCSCGCKLVADKRKSHVNYVCPKSKNLKAGCDVDVIGRKTLSEDEITIMVRELSNTILRDTDFHQQVLENMVGYVRRQMTAKGVTGIETVREIERLEARKTSLWKMMVDVGDDDFEAAQDTLKALNEEIQSKMESVTQEEVELDELLNAKFEETTWDVTGRYLNLMIRLAKEIAEEAEGNDNHPTRKAKNIQKLGRKYRNDVREIINSLIHGNEHAPLLTLIDEIQIGWRKHKGRCRPFKVACKWKVNAQTSTINIDEKDEYGFSKRLKQGLFGGMLATMVVHIVLYPTRSRAFASIKRA